MRNAVFGTVRELGSAKAGEIAQALGVDTQEIVTDLRELREEGFLDYEKGKYRLSEIKSVEAGKSLKISAKDIEVVNTSELADREASIGEALSRLELQLNKTIEPVSELALKSAVLKRLSGILQDDIGVVLEDIANDLAKYEELSAA